MSQLDALVIGVLDGDRRAVASRRGDDAPSHGMRRLFLRLTPAHLESS